MVETSHRTVPANRILCTMRALTLKGFSRTLLRLAVVALFLAISIHLVRTFGPRNCADMQRQLSDLGSGAPLFFFAAFVLATVAFVPGTVVMMVAGLTFGVVWGALISTLAGTTAATLAFLAARWLFRQPLAQLAESGAVRVWYQRLEQGIKRHGIRYIILMRMLPVVPFSALNMACGVLPVRTAEFVVGSFVGMLPATVAFANLGVAGCGLIDAVATGGLALDQVPPHILWNLVLSVAVLCILAFMPLVYQVLRRDKH